MAITLEVLKNRMDNLSSTLTASESDLDLLKERCKDVKKEIANMRGAILEIERLIEQHE